jgi:multicomponent Na+:H+ antiporter subunit E
MRPGFNSNASFNIKTTGRVMIQGIIAVLGLAALWLLMSGLYKTLILIFGALSVLLTIFIIRRMDKVDNHKLGYDIGVFSTIGYLIWLLKEIAKSNMAVSKIILSSKQPDQQKMFEVPVTQQSEIAQVIFANSITLTPGTVTVESEDDHFIVHAIDFAEGDMEALADMDARVTAIETTGSGDNS